MKKQRNPIGHLFPLSVAIVIFGCTLGREASAAGVEITPRPWYRHYDRYNYGNDWRYGKPSDYDAYYNFRLGRLTLGMTGKMSARWSDNNNHAPSNNAQTGWSLVPELTLALHYPISPYVTIDSSVSVGYRYYPDDSVGESDFFLATDAGVAAAHVGGTIILGDDHFIRVHDRLTYETETLSAETYFDGNRTRDWGMWRNTLNFTYGRRLHPDVRSEASYAFEIRRASQSEFTYLDFNQHSFDWVLWWHVLRKTEVGPYFRYSYYDFRTNERNDRDIYELGLTANIDDALGVGGLSVTMNGGYEIMNSRSDGAASDDGGGFTANFTTRYAPEAFPGHRVRASFRRNHEDPNPAVNYADELLLGYGIDIRATDDLVVTADLDWLDVGESDGGENFNMWRFWVTGTYWLTPKTSCNLSYWFTSKYGSEANNYNKNTIEIGVTHRF